MTTPRRHRNTAAWLGTATLALVGVALLLVPPHASAAKRAIYPRQARHVKPSRLVVSPRPGASVRAIPLEVVVRADDDLNDLRANLNGHPIGLEFGRTRRGKRTAAVSSTHGLRHGPNLLRVKVRQRSGQWIKTTVRFRLVNDDPLAGAGWDRRVVAGRRTKLTGIGVPMPGSGSVAAQPLEFHWRLVKAPRNSRFRADRGPVMPATPQPSFTPDVPGPFVFKLVVGDAQGATDDEVTLDAIPPSPLVPVETMAERSKLGGEAGIKVGDHLYKANIYGLHSLWQIVVLDRATLGFVSNQTYGDMGSLEHDLAGLNDTKLVIAALHRAGRPLHSDLLGFQSIGAPTMNKEEFAAGNVSIIGVPGLPPGQADVRAISDGQPGDGNMKGYLTPDQYFNYGWLPGERTTFDTRAPGTDASHNFVRVGDTDYKIELGRLESAFHVFVLDGHTLELLDGGAFVPINEDAIRDMTNFLKTKVRPGNLVFVVAVSKPDAPPMLSGVPPDESRDLAAAVASVGGTRDLFNRSGIAKDSHYALVGWGGAGEGNGEEVSAVKAPQPGDGRLRGALVPDRNSLFRPTAVSVSDQPPDALPQLLLQPPTPWPLTGDEQAQNAIAWIGAQEKRLGCDPRAAYWTQPFDEATWSRLADVVKGLEYPDKRTSDCNNGDFSAAAFSAARQELVQEMDWVGDVRAYLSNLSSPFAENAISSWANLQVIADKVKAALKPPDQRTTMLVTSVIGGILKLAGSAAPPARVASVIYDLALKFLIQDRGGGSELVIGAKADELAAQLVSRLQDTQAAFRGMGNVIVGDYAKLKTVGTLGGCSPSAAGCPPEWQFSPHDQQQAATAASRSIEAAFDRKFMALAFPSYRLGPRGNHTDAKAYACGTEKPLAPFPTFYPFQHEPADGQAALLQELPSGYDLFALANADSLGWLNGIPNMPPAGVLDRMFGAVSPSLDPKAGGLGIYRPDFMREAAAERGVQKIDWTFAKRPPNGACPIESWGPRPDE